ncbi:hypothetical protein C7271_23755 [filamentous cyanobacterium CCP5]|nr:hypothetical protein C7271_23755 [filamentous cyanobacterium CCP5]
MTTIWIEAHLSPAIAPWLTNNFEVTAVALRDLGLRDAEDTKIFGAAILRSRSRLKYFKRLRTFKQTTRSQPASFRADF